MKHVSRPYLLFLVTLIAACTKTEKLPFYASGTAPALSSDVNAVAPAASDSNNAVLTLSWTDPGYATDASTVKYIVEIDSSGKDFSNAVRTTITGSLDTTFIAKDFNSILLSLGFDFNVTYSVDIRVISSYANNNDQQFSNILTIQATPYKTPPKVQLPSSDSLYITGDATLGGWQAGGGSGVPLPDQQFSRIDSTTYGGIFYLNGGGSYLLLPVNGSWDAKYALADNSLPGIDTAGEFGFGSDTYNSNFKAPPNSGWYSINVDFQRGTYSVRPYVDTPFVQQLFITGDATASSWTNTPPASQQFTRLKSVEYEIIQSFEPGKYYKFLSMYGFWQPQFGGTSDSGGTLDANYGGGSDPSAIPTPAAAGNYKVSVNFFTKTYSVTPQ